MSTTHSRQSLAGMSLGFVRRCEVALYGSVPPRPSLDSCEPTLAALVPQRGTPGGRGAPLGRRIKVNTMTPVDSRFSLHGFQGVDHAPSP